MGLELRTSRSRVLFHQLSQPGTLGVQHFNCLSDSVWDVLKPPH